MPIFQAGSASVSIVPDFRGAQKAIGEWFASQGDLKVGVKPDLNNADLLKTKAELDALSGTAKINVDHKQLSSDLATAMADAFKGATGLFDAGKFLSGAIGPSVKIAIGGLATELASALVPALGGLALLPAAILGLAAPLAALKIGLTDVNGAFKALSTGNLQQIQKAMDKLAPSARDFVTQVHALGPAWTALRLDVQQQLFDGLGTAVTNLAHVALPVLKTGLSDIATSLNAGLILTMKQLSQDAPQFTTIFTNINLAVGQFATQGLPKLTQGFVTLASVGSQFLPGLVAGLDNLIGKFSDWVNRMNASGQLAQIMQNAITTLHQVFTLVGNIVGIVADIFKAALPFGQQFLGMLLQLTGNLKAFLGTDTAQSSLKLFFGQITNAVQIILPTLQSLAQVIITAILPAIGDFVQALAPLAATIGGALVSALSQISALVPPLAQTLAGLIGAFSPLIPVISQIALTLLPPLLKVGHDLIPVISGLTTAFGTTLLAAVKLLSPLIQPLGDAFGAILKAATPLFGAVNNVISALTPLVPVVKDLLKVFTQIVDNAVLPFLVGLINNFAAGLKVVLGWIAPAKGLIEGVAVAFGTWTAATWLLNLAMDANPIGAIIAAIGLLIAAIGFISTHLDVFKAIWNAAWGFIKKIAQDVVDWFTGPFVNFFTQTIPHFWEDAWTHVRDFFVGIWNDITGWVQTHIIDWFTGTFVNFFTNTIPNTFKSAWNGIRDFFKNLWTDLVSWFTTALNNFGGFFSRFWSDLKSGVSTLWHDIVHALEVPVQTVINWVWNDTLRPAWNLLNNLWGGTDLQPVVLPGLSAADGAVLPGFTPGRDVHHFFSPTGGMLNLSGGEAVMRPEFTAAVGPGWVNSMNATARSGGVSGVQSALGMSFADGGVWPNPNFGLSTQLGSRDIGWAQQAALGVLSAVIPFLPGGQLVAPLTKYVQAEASGSKNDGGSPIWGVAGGVFRNALNQLWDVAKKAIIATLSPGGGSYANYQADLAAKAAAAAQINLGNIGGGNINFAALGKAGNVQAVQQVANGYGWGTGAEWNALVAVINRESGFNNTAQNPTSTAYGIFQFLNSTWGSYGVPKTSDPTGQAVAGLRYIASRYHDPLGALGHEQQFGWYDQGGYLPPGWSTVYNGTGRNELVLNPQQQGALGQRLSGGGFNVGGVNIAMQSANPYEVADELVYRLRVASRGGVYSTVRG